MLSKDFRMVVWEVLYYTIVYYTIVYTYCQMLGSIFQMRRVVSPLSWCAGTCHKGIRAIRWAKLWQNLSGTDFTLCFCLFSANILHVVSVLDLYDKPAPSSAEICFKQATLSTLYTLIMANFKDCGTLLLQSLFLLSTAFVVVGHCFHILSSIIENDFESIFKRLYLAHHCAQCLADDQSQLLSTNAASLTEQTVGKMSRSCLTEQTPHSVSKKAAISTELSNFWICDKIFRKIQNLASATSALPPSILACCKTPCWGQRWKVIVTGFGI